MKFEEIIKSISDDFTDAWNQWDIDRMKDILSESVIIRSPKIMHVYPENASCEIQGKGNVIEYWNRLKEMTHNYQVVQLSIKKDGREVKTVNKMIGEDITIYETFIVNEYGKIEYLKYEYLS